jgi:hypothetical protein
MYSLKLSAYGKSNNNSDKDEWEFSNITTNFNNIEWNPNSGWYENSFRVVGENSYAIINCNPFASMTEGKTIELEFETEKVN